MFPQNKTEIKIYADESMNRDCTLTKTNWDYMCLCFVSSKEIFNIINCIRFNQGKIVPNFRVDNTNKYFEKNNMKIHFNEIRSADQFHIAKRFLEWILDNSSSKYVKFLILGLDRTKLDESKFGDEKIFDNIYNRFFRSAIKYGLKCFYSNSDIKITKIIHEVGSQQNHKYFNFHAIWKLKDDFNFECREIEFLDKDHTKNQNANLTQLCDLVLGVATHIIHNKKKNSYKDRLAEVALPLVKRAIQESKNSNSSYKHHNRFLCRFFPKSEIKTYEGNEYWNSEFYSQRPLRYLISQSKQLQLNL
jgi:hypothetical protein